MKIKDHLDVTAARFGGAATVLRRLERGTVAVDPGSIATVTRGTGTATIPGVRVGDVVVMTPPAALEDDLLFVGAIVTADDTVQVQLYNPTAGPIDGTSRTWEYLWLDLT